MTVKRIATAAAVALAMAAGPTAPALAWHHHRGGPFFLPFAIAGAVVGTAAAIATAPLAAVAPPPAPYPAYGYGPPPYGYYGPPPGYYYGPPPR